MRSQGASSYAATNRDLRIFAAVVAAGFAVLGLISWFRAGIPTQFARTVWIIAGIVLGTGLAFPRVLVPVQFVWVRVGHVLGWVNTRLLLGTLFYGVVTPFAAWFRLRGRDPLQRRRKLDTYWVRRHGKPSDYRKLH